MKYDKKLILALLVLVLGLGTFLFTGVAYVRAKQAEALAARQVAFSISLPSIDFYFFYKLFMTWVNSGVVGTNNNALSTQMVAKLKPSYSFDVSEIRYAYTSRFSNLGMTDCTKIYFGDKDIVNRLKANSALTTSQVWWLAHEVTHGEQCKRWGGREAYAKTWFKQVTNTVLNNILKGKFTSVVQDIFNAQGAAIHDSMSMEKEADQRAAKVVQGWKWP